MAFFDGVRERAVKAKDWLKAPTLPNWWRRGDMGAERRSVAARMPAFFAGFYLFIAIAAWLLEFGFASLWAVRANGELDWTWRIERAAGDVANGWGFNFAAHVLPASLTVAAVLVIVSVAVTWIPAFNALRGMGQIRRGSIGVVGPLCSLIAICGAIMVQAENMNLDARDARVVEQRAGQGRASLQASLATVQSDLDDLMGDPAIASPSYQMQACRAGAAAWAGYVRRAAAAGDGRLSQIERASESASRCDQLRLDRAAAQQAVFAAPVEAEAEETTHAISAPAVQAAIDTIADYRILLLGATLSLIGLFGPWWAQGIREARALLDPTIPEQAPAPTISSPSDEAPEIIAPIDELNLPTLADWRSVVDPEFALRHVMVDEAGRRMKRVKGHWRVDDDRAPPASQSDHRRRDDPPAPEAPAEPDAADAGDDSGDVDTLLDEMLRRGASVEEDA